MSYSIPAAALINLTSYFYLLIASLATTPSLIRALGITQFGQYVLTLGLLALITSLDLGLSRAIVYQLCRATTASNQSRIMSSSLLLHLVLGTIYGVLLAVFYSVPLGVLAFVTYLVSHYQTLPESDGKFALLSLRPILIGSANTFGAVYIAQLGYGVVEIIYLLSIFTLVTTILIYWPTRGLKYNLSYYPDYIKQILSYGLKSQYGKIVNSIQAQYPKIILASNPVGLAVYGLSSSLVSKSVGAISQLAITYFPYASRHNRSKNIARPYLLTQSILLVCGIIGIIIYQYFGLGILIWWLDDYALATQVDTFLRVYRYYALLLLLTPLASSVLDSYNMPHLPSGYAAIALFIELGVLAFLYNSLGYLGIAYGSVLSLLIMTPILLLTTQKTLSLGGKKSHLSRASAT